MTYASKAYSGLDLVVRGQNPASFIGPVKEVVQRFGAGRPVSDVRLLENYVTDASADTRFALFVLGVALLVLGVVLPLKPGGVPVVSLLGFLVMFFGAWLTLTAMRRGDAGEETGDESGASNVTKLRRSSFSQRMEERFRKRFDEEQ